MFKRRVGVSANAAEVERKESEKWAAVDRVRQAREFEKLALDRLMPYVGKALANIWIQSDHRGLGGIGFEFADGSIVKLRCSEEHLGYMEVGVSGAETPAKQGAACAR